MSQHLDSISSVEVFDTIDCFFDTVNPQTCSSSSSSFPCLGSIAQHNLEHPDVSLRVNDLLLKINGEESCFKSQKVMKTVVPGLQFGWISHFASDRFWQHVWKILEICRILTFQFWRKQWLRCNVWQSLAAPLPAPLVPYVVLPVPCFVSPRKKASRWRRLCCEFDSGHSVRCVKLKWLLNNRDSSWFPSSITGWLWWLSWVENNGK